MTMLDISALAPNRLARPIASRKPILLAFPISCFFSLPFLFFLFFYLPLITGSEAEEAIATSLRNDVRIWNSLFQLRFGFFPPQCSRISSEGGGDERKAGKKETEASPCRDVSRYSLVPARRSGKEREREREREREKATDLALRFLLADSAGKKRGERETFDRPTAPRIVLGRVSSGSMVTR